MRTPLILLKIIGKVALHASGVGGLWSIVVEDVPQLANNVWNEWKAARNPAERRADLEAVAVLDDNTAPDVEAVVAEIAADQPTSVREELAAYLTQIPASIRQTLRRPADPTGLTVPPALEPRSGQDLIPFLASQRPRFKAGDRPIPGADWVLDELLGIGGFGEVWKARHAHIDDFPPAALKFCIDPQARERLLKHEARICARVQREGKHPGIVELQHTYLSADPPCLQYEYVEGGTLANLIKDFAGREVLPAPKHVAQLMLAIAKPVAFAHRLNPPIVHRDLKPANILLQVTNGSTRVKIADFGIGGIATAAVIRATRQPTHPNLLLTKAVSGSHSPLYASPEQAAGGPPDPRDDVHALGVIWYQMLTGRMTVGPSGGDAWRKKLADRGMSPALIKLLVSCLEEAAERVADAAVLSERIKSSLLEAERDSLLYSSFDETKSVKSAHLEVEKAPPSYEVEKAPPSYNKPAPKAPVEIERRPVPPPLAPTPLPKIEPPSAQTPRPGSTTDRVAPAASKRPASSPKPRPSDAKRSKVDGVEREYEYKTKWTTIVAGVVLGPPFAFFVLNNINNIIGLGPVKATFIFFAGFVFFLMPLACLFNAYERITSRRPTRIVFGPKSLIVPGSMWSPREREIAYKDMLGFSTLKQYGTRSLFIQQRGGLFTTILSSRLPSKVAFEEIVELLSVKLQTSRSA